LEKFLGCKGVGFFIEARDYDSLFFSDSWGLAKRGWNGWLIEPVPALADRCRANHVDHDGVIVVQCIIGSGVNSEEVLYSADTLTTANKAAFDEYKGVGWARSVLMPDKSLAPATKLDDFLTEYRVPRNFDLLIVHVEVFEIEVFRDFPSIPGNQK
jgi:hypothetical protein